MASKIPLSTGFKQWPTYKKVLLIIGIILALIAVIIFSLRIYHNQQATIGKARPTQPAGDTFQ